MGYYGMRGDYYRGGKRGDLLGAIGGAIKGAVGGFITGGPGGALAGAIAGGVKGAVASGGGGAGPSGFGSIPKLPIPGFGGGVGSIQHFGQPLSGGGGAPRGYHVSKKTGKVVRNRHMNVTNAHALRRSIRRARGFEKLAMRVIGFTRPHGRPKGHPYFKKSRARR